VAAGEPQFGQVVALPTGADAALAIDSVDRVYIVELSRRVGVTIL
jgi:hypothetical protein